MEAPESMSLHDEPQKDTNVTNNIEKNDNPGIEQHDIPTNQDSDAVNDNVESVEEIEIDIIRIDDTTPISKDEILEALNNLLEKNGDEISRELIGKYKQAFNNLRRKEIEDEKTTFIEGGGNEEDFLPSIDLAEQKLLDIINQLRQKKTHWLEEREKELKSNLEKKEEIIDEICKLANETDTINKSYSHFKELTQQFRELGAVPPENTTSIWKKFQDAEQLFYDHLKINQELRDYDFKKNLEVKKGIIEKAQELAQKAVENVDDITQTVNNNIIDSFRSLQDLHELWKVTGPVAKELRDELWESFRQATVTVNKAYQSFFEQRKATEKANEETKRALVDQIEQINYTALKTAKDWENKTKEVLEAQANWKTTGFASRKVNNALFTQFRNACDNFFNKKSDFYNELRSSHAANLEKKLQLTLRAEELKDSTDWNATAKELVKLQKQWKEIGSTPRKQGDELWERFHTACDSFFEKRKTHVQDLVKAEKENLEKKEDILKKLVALLEENEDVKEKFQQLQQQWKEIGYVPFKDKNRISDEYHNAINKIRKKFNLNELKASFDKFRSNVEEIAGDQNKLNRERERLFRYLENKRNDLNNYLNNMGFFKSKTKDADGLLKEVEHKIQLIESDIADLEQKINLIDSKLN